MAGKGTYTAYRQLKPLEGDISQDIQQQEENGFRRRALDQVDQRTQIEKADKEEQRKQALWDKHVKPLSNYDTGSASLNEAQGRLILEAQKEYVPLMSVINNPKSTDEEKLKATLKLQNINSLPDNLASMTKNLTDRDLAIRKGVAEGTLFPDKAYETNFQTGYKNKLLTLDENGLPMIAFNNPDGTQDFETYDKIQNVVPKYDIQKRFDRDKELLEASTKLQPEIIQTDDGRQQVKTTAINPALLKEYVNNQLYEADGVTPTAKLKSFARESGITNLQDAKALKSISDAFENDIRLRVKGGTEVTKKYNDLDVLKENRQAAKDARAEKKEEAKTAVEKTTTTFDSSMRKDDFTGKVLQKDAVRPNMISIIGENLKFKNLGGAKSGLNDGFITGFALDKEGNIVATGKALLTKGNKYKKGSDEEGSTDPTLDSYSTGSNYGNFRRIVRGTELSDLITRAGYSNENELKSELKKMNSSKSSNTSNKIKIDY
jgi:hypothetical protein